MNEHGHAAVASRWRHPLVALAALRYLLPIAALPLAPRLIPEDVGLLTLLRPGKEVLLLAGGLSRTDGTPGLTIAFVAYLPLMVGGVWAFFGLGRAYASDLEAGTGPGWLHRAIPDERLAQTRMLLTHRGPEVAILGRLAALPPTVLAAAAGTSRVTTWRYLVADLVGAILAFGLVFGIGLGLGETYERAGPWLTAGTIILLVPAMLLLSRWLRSELVPATASTEAS